MGALTFVTAVFVLLFGWFIHLAYKHLMRQREYCGVTIFECTAICIATIPGLVGCASGWIGFAFPLPLIVALPMSLALIGNESCGWQPPIAFVKGELELTSPSFMTAWLVGNVVVIGLLYFSKISSQRLRSRRMR